MPAVPKPLRSTLTSSSPLLLLDSAARLASVAACAWLPPPQEAPHRSLCRCRFGCVLIQATMGELGLQAKLAAIPSV